MKFRTTWRLFLVVCLLAGVIWIAERHFESTDEHRRRSARLLPGGVEDVEYLLLERGDSRIRCVRKDRTWFLAQPVEARAAEEEMDRIFSALEALPDAPGAPPDPLAPTFSDLESPRFQSVPPPGFEEITANWLYSSNNPRSRTICPRCKPLIGHVFSPTRYPHLPRHGNCYCYWRITGDPVTWPPDKPWPP